MTGTARCFPVSHWEYCWEYYQSLLTPEEKEKILLVQRQAKYELNKLDHKKV